MANTIDVSRAEAQEPCSFPVYMIHSRESLQQLDNRLSDYGEAGFLRIVYDNNGKDTNRTIAILQQSTYDALCRDGYGESEDEPRTYGQDFRIAPFRLDKNCFPGPGRNKNLFIPVPKSLSDNDGLVKTAIIDKLKHLAEWDIIEDGSWSVNVPLQSREKGGVKGGCYISFRRDVPDARIAMVRILLTDTYWPETDDDSNRPIFKCFWSRDRKPRTEDGETKKFHTDGEDIKKFERREKRPPRTSSKADPKEASSKASESTTVEQNTGPSKKSQEEVNPKGEDKKPQRKGKQWAEKKSQGNDKQKESEKKFSPQEGKQKDKDEKRKGIQSIAKSARPIQKTPLTMPSIQQPVPIGEVPLTSMDDAQ